MHKLMILIEDTVNQEEFEGGWPSFLKLVESLPGLRREATTNVENLVFGRFTYQIIHELFFDKMDDTRAAMSTEAGREAGKILQQITQGKLTILFADHKEDIPENILKYREQPLDE